ncbi:hypothetical protein [Bradyrhizobium sp. 930_D9_N1_4]|uniref:hypothetical protein n=1 Tax=Bradyrhizobium sp. 930_D9_N1_4 TaxID=3240374 RepID=UPI003F88C80B
MDYQKQNYDKASANLTPFINTGTGANNLLASFYGINGSDPALGQNALQRFQQSPDYQFALKGGTEALDNSAAAKGGVLGGNQIRAQTEYGAGLATQNLSNYLTRLSGLSGQGIQAGGYLGQIGTGVGTQVGASASNVANSTMAAGTAEASGILGTVKGIDSGLNSLSLYNQMGKSSYGGGSNYLANYNGNQIGGLY